MTANTLKNHDLVPNFTTQISTLSQCVGKTPLVKLVRLVNAQNNAKSTHAENHEAPLVLAKLEGNNPAGSVKDRAAFNMIVQAEQRGQINAGDTLIEATSGNTGIALAMVAAMRGYKMTLIMPSNSTQERKDAMTAYGATLIETEGMEQARDLALQMQAEGKGVVLDQFNNPDNLQAHYLTTGPELWEQTGGKITHFVSSMGTTGTIMGVSKFLKRKIPIFKLLAYALMKMPPLLGFAAGKKPIYPRFLMKVAWIGSLISTKPPLRGICESLRWKRGYFAVYHQEQRLGRRCKLPKRKSARAILMR